MRNTLYIYIVIIYYVGSHIVIVALKVRADRSLLLNNTPSTFSRYFFTFSMYAVTIFKGNQLTNILFTYFTKPLRHNNSTNSYI